MRTLGAFLLVFFLAPPQDDPPTGMVTGLHARHEAGQTILTWREVDPPVTAEAIPMAELRKTRSGLDKENKVRYRIYRSEQLIDQKNIQSIKPIAEVPPLTCWNADYTGIDCKPEHQAMRYVVNEGKGPVPPGTGIYAHNPAAAGEAYYAVTRSVNGKENTATCGANSLSTPVPETVGPGAPVLQRTERPKESNYVKDPTIHYYVRWEAPPRSNLPSRPFDYRVGIPPNPARPAPLGIHLHCWGGNLDGGYMWWYRASDGAMMIASNQIPYDWWVAYHEKLGISKDWKDGVTRDYTVKRLLAFADWAATKWEIDRPRTFVAGASMGGSGAAMLAVRYPDRFACAYSSVGVHIASRSPQFKGSYEAVCGPAALDVPHESGLKTFEYLDNAFLLRKDPGRDLPLICFANGKNDGAIGWPQAAEFARALQETRQPHLFTWGQSGHGERVYVPTATGGGDGGPGLRGALDLRTDQSLPAFTRCSLDDNPGNGDPADGDRKGQINLYLRWDPKDLVDEEDRWEITLWLIDSAPKDSCTVDVTPRRLQKLKRKPGDAFRWSSTSLKDGREIQAGTAPADAHGLLTCKEVQIAKGKNRIRICRP